MRPFFPSAAAPVLATALLFAAATAAALDAGLPPPRPHTSVQQPRQRTLTEVEAVPERMLACPVCGTEVRAPDADLMVRRPANLSENAPAPKWEMHAADRDADRAPYPTPQFLSYQADIVLCPDCGYANAFDAFARPVSPEAAQWVRASLTPELRAAERALVGSRAATMTDEELVAFFNHQELLPDTLRTEHYRTWLAAVHAPPARQAQAAMLAAWAARRDVAAAPKAALFAGRAAALAEELRGAQRARPGLPGDIDAVLARLRRLRQRSKNTLPGAEDMTLRVLLAGLYVRLGFPGEAEVIYENLFTELRERFLRHEQDPIWPATTPRASVAARLNELELLRADAEKEMFVKAELVRRERALLLAAADHLRDAFRQGAFDGDRDEALFQAYLTGEFLRRAGDLPLAAEWFNNLLALVPEGTELAKAAKNQLEYVGEVAGDKVNLLSALGKDGGLFAKLRDIARSAEHAQ